MQLMGADAAEELDDDGLVAAYPWPAEGPWVRAMMVTTLDGAAAGADGLSGSISSDGDRAVFLAVRRLADAVLVGGGTVRDEEYGPVLARPEDAAARSAQGSGPAAVLAIVSRSLDLPWEAETFAGAAVRPLVLTGEDPDPERAARAGVHCDLVHLPSPVDTSAHGSAIDARAVLRALTDRGLTRIVCEGGPTLLQAVIEADLLDEAAITIAPLLAGTERTPRTPMLSRPERFALAHVIEDEGFLMNRYVRATPTATTTPTTGPEATP